MRKFEKSQPGGIQDMMNAVDAYMRGYGFEYVASEDEENICKVSDKGRTAHCRNAYRLNKAQWQIGHIEIAAKEWGLDLLEMFELAKFLLSYCPSFTGTHADYIRLKNLGRSVKDLGLAPTKASDIAKIKQLQEAVEQVRKLAEAAGVQLNITM